MRSYIPARKKQISTRPSQAQNFGPNSSTPSLSWHASEHASSTIQSPSSRHRPHNSHGVIIKDYHLDLSCSCAPPQLAPIRPCRYPRGSEARRQSKRSMSEKRYENTSIFDSTVWGGGRPIAPIQSRHFCSDARKDHLTTHKNTRQKKHRSNHRVARRVQSQCQLKTSCPHYVGAVCAKKKPLLIRACCATPLQHQPNRNAHLCPQGVKQGTLHTVKHQPK